ncbi:MAG TPA: anti-sigma factor [Caulobacteraceae bacterium]|nr:anti-sigma factor [Caulobacteraceae bacterium]
MSDPIQTDEPDMTAAEFALGVLDGEDRRAAAARAAGDPAFAAEVAAWEERLTPMAAGVIPMEPSPQVWTRIAAALGTTPGLWNSVVFWRGATLAGIAAAAASLAIVAGPLLRTPAPPINAPQTILPVEVASLSTKPGEPASVVATLDPNSHELVLTPVALKLTDDQSPELWVIPAGAQPISLGVMDRTKPYRIPIPMQMNGEGRTTAQLVVTAEQLGGSPDKKPHGPAIAAGKFGQA